MPKRWPTTATVIAGVALLLALASTLHSGPKLWRGLGHERSASAALSGTRRRSAALEASGVPGAVFDFYSQFTVPGDRVYLQVAPGGGRPAAFAAAARYYLLPALVTDRLSDATVVISYGEQPSRLHRHFISRRQLGGREVYVSRIGVP